MNHSYYRRKLFSKFFEPSGFVLQNGLYIRSQGDQRHAIDYQVLSGIPGSFRINLGFDYAFVPSWSAFEYLDVSQLRITQFNLRRSLGDITGWPDDRIYYSDNPEEYTSQLNQIIQDVLRIFKDRSEAWKDPVYFIKTYPPESFKKNRSPLYNKKWQQDWDPRVSFLASIALHLKKYEAAVFYAEWGIARWDNKRFQALMKHIITLSSRQASKRIKARASRRVASKPVSVKDGQEK